MSDPTETLQDHRRAPTASETEDVAEPTTRTPRPTPTTPAPEAGAPVQALERLEQEGDIAADYLEELLDIADLDGDLDMDVEGDRAAVSIVGADLAQLVGPRRGAGGAAGADPAGGLPRDRRALPADARHRRAPRRPARALEEQAAEMVAEVRSRASRSRSTPMTPFERKVVHDAVAAAGLTSESEGAEPGATSWCSRPDRIHRSGLFHVKQHRERQHDRAPPRRRGAGGCSRRTACPWRSVRRPAGHRGRRPRPDRPARGAPALGAAHLLNCAVLADVVPEGATVCDIGSGRACPAWCWRSRDRTCG